MLAFITDAWQGAAEVVLALADGALGVLIIMWDTFAALPLPITLIIITAGLAIGHALAQRADH